MKTGCLILAGGKSRRMGTEKSSLRLDGKTFLKCLSDELEGFGEIVVSVDHIECHEEIGMPMVEDVYPEHGPMGGIYSALVGDRFDEILTVPCDVPLFSKKFAERLYGLLRDNVDAVITVTDDGRIHPLCGIYRKSCLPVMKECLEKRELRMMSMLEHLNVVYMEAGEDSWQLQNINTPEEYKALLSNHLQ